MNPRIQACATIAVGGALALVGAWWIFGGAACCSGRPRAFAYGYSGFGIAIAALGLWALRGGEGARGFIRRNSLWTALVVLAIAASVLAIALSGLQSAPIQKQARQAPTAEPKREVLVPAASETPERRAEVEFHHPAPAGPAGPIRASLVVRLTDGTQRLEQGTIEIESERGKSRIRKIDTATQEATFPDLELGRYRVVALTDLPPGILPPRSLGRGAVSDKIWTTVALDPNLLEILLERGARVFGYVRGADGEPLDNSVRFSSTAVQWEESFRSIDLTVSKGYYEGEMYPGTSRAEVLDPLTGTGERETLPAPRIVNLPPGSATQIDFVLERGTARIDGRTLDERGAPFEGLTLYIYRRFIGHDPVSGREIPSSMGAGRAVTDEDGGFSFATLGAGKYVIDVCTDRYHPLGKPGENQIGAVYPGKHLELREGELVETELVVLRPHPVRVRGSVSLDPAWASRTGATPGGAWIKILTQDHRPDGLVTKRFIESRDGAFDFYIDASASEPRLLVQLGGEIAIYPLALVPDAELTPVVLRFPK